MRDFKADLVIVDIMMPEMDGLEVVQAIRKVNTELPIIAISGGMRHAAINFVTFAQEFGANVIFKKPVALSDLLKSVQQLFTNSKSLILY